METIDVVKAIESCGGEEMYAQLLSAYRRDLSTKTTELQKAFAEGDISLFTTNVHGIKSASRLIGAFAFGDFCQELEMLGKAKDVTSIEKELPLFFETVEKIAPQINSLYDKYAPKEEEKPFSPELDLVVLSDLADAAEDMDIDEMERLLKEILQYSYPTKQTSVVNKLRELVESFSYEETEGLLRVYLSMKS